MTTGITSILKNILKFITFIGAVVAAVFLLRAFVIEPFVVPTGSMESTIEVAYVEPPLRSFELSEKEACLTECGILETTRATFEPH